MRHWEQEHSMVAARTAADSKPADTAAWGMRLGQRKPRREVGQRMAGGTLGVPRGHRAAAVMCCPHADASRGHRRLAATAGAAEAYTPRRPKWARAPITCVSVLQQLRERGWASSHAVVPLIPLMCSEEVWFGCASASCGCRKGSAGRKGCSVGRD